MPVCRRARRAAQSFPVFAEILEPRLLMARLAWVGDLKNTSGLSGDANLIKSWNPDVIFATGDLTHGDSSVDQTVGRYFQDYVSPYNGAFGAGSSSGNRFYSAIGNHDYSDHPISEYLSYFIFPGNERYYNVRVDSTVELFFINSNSQESAGTSSTSTQGQWLKNALGASTAKWKLVMFHHPAYTSGTEGNHPGMQWPFQAWGATAVLSGHDHMYERISKSGFPYFVNGLGGAPIVPPQRVESGSQIRYSSNYGAMRIDTNESSINFKFINTSGTVIDDCTITSQSPSPPPPPPPPPPSGSSTTFIPTGASWRYLDNGSDRGTAWKQSVFADAGWKTGNAQLGYGDGDEATVVSYGTSATNKFVTTYFRKSFNVADKSQVSSLQLRLRRDDGAVVYLNGAEVFRSNMPAGTIGYQTFASSTVEDETFKLSSINPALLVDGANVIAVEVHQADRSSSDVSFDLSLSGVTGTPTSPPSPPPPPSSDTYVSDLAWASASNGYGPVEKDRSNGGSAANDGGAITLNGVVHPKGLGAHANSQIGYNLAGAYATFMSDIGVDDRQTTNGSIVFQVFLDGVKAYDSGVMRPTTATKTVNLNVTGVSQLRLVVTDAGDGIDYDHADWAGARLTRAAAGSSAMIATDAGTILTGTTKRDLLELLT